jgi:hypothetical protein
MAVAIDVGPHLHALADDPFDGKTAAVDRGINVLDMESANGTLDSLRSFVHGDAAIDVEMTSRSQEGDAPGLYTKPFTGHWFQGNTAQGRALTTVYPLIVFVQFRDAYQTVACKPRAEWTFSLKPETREFRPNLSTVKATGM